MKTVQILFILICILGLFHTATAEENSREILAEPEPGMLILKAHPVLEALSDFYISIEPPDVNLPDNDVFWKKLRKQIEHKLNAHKINYILHPTFANDSALTIKVDLLKLDESELYVFRVQSSMVTGVHLPGRSRLRIQAPVWETEATIKSAKTNDTPDELATVVLEQIEVFARAWKDSHSAKKLPQDMPEKPTPLIEKVVPVQPTVKQSPVLSPYIASKKSKIFHRADCSSGQNIKPENLVTYKTRAEALKDGKRPCKICKP